MDFDDFDLPDFDLPGDDDEPDFITARQLAAPVRFERREAKRVMVNGLKREALSTLIPVLPPPDTDLYIISNGSGAERIQGRIDARAIDFGTFVPVLVDLLGAQGCTAYISTWTMNRNHALMLLELLDTGALARLTVATDPYFTRREAAIAATLIQGLDERGQQFRAWKNHVKAVCIASADNRRFVTVTGSANMSAQPRCEQFTLTTAPDVYQFFVTEFFEAMMAAPAHVPKGTRNRTPKVSR